MAYVMIDWSTHRECYLVRSVQGVVTWHKTAEAAVENALLVDTKIRVNEGMDGRRLTEVMAAAIFKGVEIHDIHGGVMVNTPVPTAKVGYITREQIGPILPEGWFIECQLNRYAACCGEMVTLPARKSIAAAISDIHEFLTLSIQQANDDLKASVRAQRERAEMEQLTFGLSSDSAERAVENSTELDSMA